MARGNQFSRPHVNSAEMPLIALVQRIGPVILHDLVSRTLWAMEYVRLEGSISLRRALPSVQRLTRLGSSPVAPQVNQLLVHVGNTPSDLLAYCKEKGIQVQAYSPIAHGEILKSAEVSTIAQRYGVTVPQLCIRYTLQLGTVSLPKTSNRDHLRSNAQVDFEISSEDMSTLRDIDYKNYGESSAFPVYSGK